ncbi:MAG: type VI secretion system membrane subunit TssM, partial [Halomonadaceae bacterium]
MMTGRTLMLLLGALAVALLVWFGGPLLALADWKPLASVAARVIFLLLLVVGFLLRHLWRSRRQRADNEKVVNEMMAVTEEDDLLKEELNTQRERMRKALALVKKWRPGRFRSVYELPWYMIIGAPGSGKSTALLNSGLEFPLKEEMGIDAVKGVGGTRYCDWWFTNRAVIIDTAGRYTTQESVDKRDARGWNAFLGLLKKYRARQPINGVILSVSVQDLLEQTQTERMLHARALKQRVQELKNRLGVVFPVYVVLTKFDLLEGFSDTFAMLSEQEREEVLGMTFQLHSVRDPEALPAAFEGEFDGLIERLSDYLLHRIQQERTTATSQRIYRFPKQVALLRAPLWQLIKEVFYPSAYEEAPLLRGIYLVSSEQGGKTCDKIADLVEDQFSLTMANNPTRPLPVTRDGFFLRHLFDRIIFSEQGLASADGRRERRFQWLRRTSFGVMMLATLSLVGAWFLSYQWNTQLVTTYAGSMNSLEEVISEQQQDWIQLDQLLSRAASLPGVLGSPFPPGGPRALGLFQGHELGQAAEGVYGRLLQHRFAAELAQVLEIEINSHLSQLEYLYETLKAYLMLNQRQHLEGEHLQAWFEQLLYRHLPGEINQPTRESLLDHLSHYLALGNSLPVKGELVARARDELTAMPLDERAYQRIQMDASESRFSDFRLPMVLGSVAERVFENRSGNSLNRGIPALYTLNGYKGIFQPGKNKIIGRLLEDSWVYGEAAADFRDLDEAHIRAGVKDRYFRDYVHHWQQMLSDLRLRSFSNDAEAGRLAGLLAGPEAPVNRLLSAVSYNTTLAVDESREESALGDTARMAADRAADRASRRTGGMSRMMPLPGGGTDDGDGTTLVDRTFKPVHSIDEESLMDLQSDARLMARYYEEQAANRPRALRTVERAEFDGALQSFYGRLRDQETPLLQEMLGGFVRESRRLVQASATREINSIWRNQVYDEYRSAIAGKYPLNPEASQEVAMADFAAFFGHGGTLDRFFQQHLKNHVDTRRSPWRLTGDLAISQSSLRFIEHGQNIRQAFFGDGGRQPLVRFTLRPLHLDNHLTQMMLDIEDQALVYRHGPTRSQAFRWPQEEAARQSRLAL